MRNIKLIIILFLLVAIGLFSAGGTQAGRPAPKMPDYASDEILVKLRPGVLLQDIVTFQPRTNSASFNILLSRSGAIKIKKVFKEGADKNLGLNRWVKVKVRKGVDVTGVLNYFKAHPAVEDAELNYKVRPLWAPNDVRCTAYWDSIFI